MKDTSNIAMKRPIVAMLVACFCVTFLYGWGVMWGSKICEEDLRGTLCGLGFWAQTSQKEWGKLS
jgi:hypothetical protein